MNFQYYRKGDVDIVAKKSEAKPGTITVFVTGPTEQSVSNALDELMNCSGNGCFIVPLECPDGAWTSFGRVHQ